MCFFGLTKDNSTVSFLAKISTSAFQFCFLQLKSRIGFDCNTIFQHNILSIVRYFATCSFNYEHSLCITNTVSSWANAQLKDAKEYFLSRLEKQLGNHRWKKNCAEQRSYDQFTYCTVNCLFPQHLAQNDIFNGLLGWEVEECIISCARELSWLVLFITINVKFLWEDESEPIS